jgi:hypothetical protein
LRYSPANALNTVSNPMRHARLYSFRGIALPCLLLVSSAWGEQPTPTGNAASSAYDVVSVGSTHVYAYPLNGQSEKQQANDSEACLKQSGFNPVPDGEEHVPHLGALRACLEGRGYSVTISA